jgi:large subunit ribosomal protein L13
MVSKTFMAKAENVERKCYLIDAKDKVLGRVAAKAASILRGKHKVIYTPHVDTGDMVVIINAEKIKVTGNKMTDKIYARYSGYAGGRKTIAFQDLMKKNPTTALELAVTRMIPKGPLGSKVKTKLRIYAGEKHPHTAQKPIALEI